MTGEHGICEGVKWQRSAAVCRHHVVGQRYRARGPVDVSDKAVAVYHRRLDARVQFLVIISPESDPVGIVVPRYALVAGLVKQVHASHADKNHLENRVPDKKSGDHGCHRD